jgi:DNA helicase HerA-like ATPase
MAGDTMTFSSSARCLDGRTFSAPLMADAPVVSGDLVRLGVDHGTSVLGQVLRKDLDDGVTSCAGSLLGEITANGRGLEHTVRPFSGARLTHASAGDWELVQASGGATMNIGAIETQSGSLPARLRPNGFNRHTFLCGQSGSGKTYTLGVILERLLIATELRMVIVDPNSDFVRLDQIRADAPEPAAERLRAAGVRILRPGETSPSPLRSRFTTMSAQTKAAILQLDPLADRDEYNALLHLPDDLRSSDAATIARQLREGDDAEQALGKRIENLGVLDWEIWARTADSVVEVVESGPRVTVLDLSGFRYPAERLVVVLDLLDYLWKSRERRIPTLLVIDEAHNVCSAQPVGSVQTAATDRLIQIAGEGRKYGLWLLLSTQRPSKIHPNVLSQCDNLALMRMNSPGDLAELQAVFGFAPPAMLAVSPSFRQGEILVAGGFVPGPAFVHAGTRHTYEGGADVSVPVAAS